MTPADKNLKELLDGLTERAKELNCIYRVEEILRTGPSDLRQVFAQIIRVVPPGWQFPSICQCRIVFEEQEVAPPGYQAGGFRMSSPINLDNVQAGFIEVCYVQNPAIKGQDPFLPEEKTLLDNLAERIGSYIFHQRLKHTLQQLEDNLQEQPGYKHEWKVIIDLLKSSDINLFLRVSRKMMNYLCWIGISRARKLLQSYTADKGGLNTTSSGNVYDTNAPILKKDFESIINISDRAFAIAEQELGDEEILQIVRKWLQEDKISFLVLALENMGTALSDIQNALTRYHHLGLSGVELSRYTQKNISVLLILRFYTEHLEFINIAKDYAHIEYFYALTQRMVFPSRGHGKLGGKSAGIFLAQHILDEAGIKVKTPRAWYLTSDTMHHFLYYNDLKEIIEQKYKEIDQIREEYPNIVQIFKNSYFPPEIVKGLALALDDLGEVPLIVRSSSLLEDRIGAAFSGKYKSLFLANQGTREERLEALLDAVAEVYASTFGPDPIEYRRERQLLDFHEEMAILIQEVVGNRVGDYFLPSFAGVAFSNNEFRWSPRIKRTDGLLRIVPGLGTRAVDRLRDDYPVLVSPGQPELRVNITDEEVQRYSPQKLDVLNLATNSFETVTLEQLMKAHGDDYPAADKVVSVLENGLLVNKPALGIDFASDTLVATCDGIISDRKFMRNMKDILDTISAKMAVPVDIEFASDGTDLYLLQCRAQSYKADHLPAPIPQDISENDILFNARRFVSNGSLDDITHIVYIDPDGYSSIPGLEGLKKVGRAVGSLNTVLPKRKFILMGPGRWGSRGDIKLGVNVTYADINNCAMLVEIARRSGNYVPDLSFGTHFFQDLVETGIRYLPLYPDEHESTFNSYFFRIADNILPNLLPQYKDLADTIKVIDIEREAPGRTLHILCNAEIDLAVAYLEKPPQVTDYMNPVKPQIRTDRDEQSHWIWRQRMAQHIASVVDPHSFGIVNLYLFGSTKNANAGPASDIDLLIHFSGTNEQKQALLSWLDGWSLALSEMNYLKTGYKTKGLLDVHIITDEDIAKGDSFAIKIGSITDPAQPLQLTRKQDNP